MSTTMLRTKLVTIAALCLLCFASKAQPIPPGLISARMSAIGSQWIGATAFHSLTHTIQGNEMDSVYNYIAQLNEAITGASGLCGVLSAGNYCGSGTPMILGNGSDSTIISAGVISGWQTGASHVGFGLAVSGGGGELTCYDISVPTHWWTMYSAGLTQNESIYIPVLNTTGYTNNALVTATTPLNLTVTNGTNHISLSPTTAVIAGVAASYSYSVTPNGFYTSDGTNSSYISPVQIESTNGTRAFSLTTTNWNFVDGGGHSNQGSPSGITQTDGTYTFSLSSGNLTLYNGSGNLIQLGSIGGTGGVITYTDGSGSGYKSTIYTNGLTANVTNYNPSHSGTIATNDGGSASISGLSTATHTTITHGLPYTPSRILIIPTDATTGAALSGYWISAIGSTTFTLNFPSFTGTLNFSWQAF